MKEGAEKWERRYYRNNYRLIIMIPIHAIHHNQIQLNTLKFSRGKIYNEALDNFRLLLNERNRAS